MDRLSRRDFLKAAAASTAVVAAGSVLTACAPTTETPPSGSTEEIVPSTSGWRVKPDPVEDSLIKETHNADYIVIGVNVSGVNVVRSIAEDSSHTVIGIDQQPQAEFISWANDIGHINSQYITEQGVAKVDPIEYFNDFMMRTGNTAHPELIMQFAQNMGDNIDWFLAGVDDKFKEYLGISYFPKLPEMLDEVGGQKFWNGALQFRSDTIYYLFDVFRDMHTKLMERDNCDIHFETLAQYLEQDGAGKVTGVIATDANGDYIRYSCNNAVVLAAGDFAANPEMEEELLATTSDIFQEGRSEWGTPMGAMEGGCCDGKGIQMGYWAGGRLEPRPLGSMNGDFAQATNNYPGVCVCLDYKGRRFMNEFFGDSVMTGKAAARINQSVYYAIFDSNMPERIKYSISGHSLFDPTKESNIENVRTGIANALSGVVAEQSEGPPGPGGGIPTFVVGNTLDELGANLGMDNEATTNMKAAVERYNELVATGRDEDFGKDSRALFPIDTPPYVACTTSGGSIIGGIMVTVGGLMTDRYQNVVNEQMDPIEGLYATGNCCGRRFGVQYFTPVPGTSVSMAITLGRELGKHLAEQ
jgi:succinate dehydrogenase/fumarate reductase flavoprotein subunit